MNNILFNYLIKNYLKTICVVVLIIYSFGLILNLFEEIEFFKESDANIFQPLILSSIFIPSLIIKLLPFIIFFSSMWFITKIRNNKDLLILKVYGYSNFRIFIILALTSFLLGWMILIIVNPITSSMVMYYEKTKSQYARDIEHLISFNKNGLWIKENLEKGNRIITAEKPEKFDLINVTIFQFDKNDKLSSKIFAEKVNIKKKKWVLEDVVISELKNEIFVKNKVDKYQIYSNYDYAKINTLFNNADTISFIDLTFKKKEMLEIGYNETFLKENLHSMLSIPFFLFLMTALATVLAMISLRRYEGFKFFIIGFVISIVIYYFKDFSLALGKTDRIPIVLAIWSPVLALSLFTLIGVLQINEK
jgi:lipopolysaccharide export system permease protein